jgi:hypothetical protein
MERNMPKAENEIARRLHKREKPTQFVFFYASESCFLLSSISTILGWTKRHINRKVFEG